MKLATVNGERYKLKIEQVIPAIKARMRRPPSHKIFVQQDGAKPHTGKGIMEATQDATGDITLKTQPANASDLNVNDLGFFHSMQQLGEDVGVINGEELVEATKEAFDVYPRETLKRIWQSLFAVSGVHGCKGDNSYQMPYSVKDKLARAGNLPEESTGK
ncbi:unnamed protein product [Discosporangium mesarthrocarpum]